MELSVPQVFGATVLSVESLTKSVSPGVQGNAARGSIARVLMVSYPASASG